MEGFLDMYDPQGYPLWLCDYKYNNENNISFVTVSNVSGFLKQADHAREYACGKMLVSGLDPPSKVKVLWLFRVQGIPQLVINDCSNTELYEWRDVDILDETQ